MNICKLLFVLSYVFFGFSPVLAADNIEISPQVIDRKVSPREILEYKIVLKNNYSIKKELYAVMFDITDKEGEVLYGGPGTADKSSSISSWASLSRGEVELMPGEKKEIPLDFKVNLSALPGSYHAAVYYVPASNMYEAESMARSGAWPKISINFEVGDQTVEKAQISRFLTGRNIYLSGPINFIVNLSNNGNTQIIPAGSIRIYDRRGEELAILDFNQDRLGIDPGGQNEFVNSWNISREMGKFKAIAEIEYGQKDKKYYQDTIFFWVIPSRLLVLFFLGTFFLLALFIVLFFKSRKGYHMEASGDEAREAGEEVINLKK